MALTLIRPASDECGNRRPDKAQPPSGTKAMNPGPNNYEISAASARRLPGETGRYSAAEGYANRSYPDPARAETLAPRICASVIGAAKRAFASGDTSNAGFSLASTIATCQISSTCAAFCRCASFGRCNANTHYRRFSQLIDHRFQRDRRNAEAFAQAADRAA